MYNDTLKVANRIISERDLSDIFYKMWDEIEKYKKMCKQEEMQNAMYEREYQNWSCKGFEGTLKFEVDFYDDTSISFDNYQNFMSIFNNRLDEVKWIYVRYTYSYTVAHPGVESQMYFQHIYMDIRDNKMSIDVKLSSEDRKMDDVYNLIKERILNAPEKYDRVIRKKTSISNKITLAAGLIPSMVLLFLLVFVPTIRKVYSMTYVLFPIGCILFSFIIGGIVVLGKLDRLYKNLLPEEKYAGYDRNKGTSVYKADVDSYVNTGEILIGKNVNNLKNRSEIIRMEKSYSKLIPYELLALAILSIIIVIVGKFI